MKILKVLFCIFSAILLLNCTAAAQGDNSIRDELEISGAESLYEQLSDDLKNALYDIGIDSLEPDDLLEMRFTDLTSYILKLMQKKLYAPIKIFALVAGVIILNSLFASFRETLTEQSAAAKTIAVVSVLAAFSIIAAPIANAVGNCVEVIRQCGNFMLSFVPVFGSVLTLSGKTATAGTYSTLLLFVVEMMSQLISAVLLPLITVYMAFSVSGAVSNTVNLNDMAETVKKVVMWSLGIALTVFIGFISFQSIVANASDTVGVRTAKYIIGSSVPIVGGAMSEAFNTLSGCMGLLKSTVGIFGIIVCLILLLPILIETALMMLALNLTSFFGSMLGDDCTVKLIKSASSAMSMLLGILLFYMMMCILSTAVILVVGTGGI